MSDSARQAVRAPARSMPISASGSGAARPSPLRDVRILLVEDERSLADWLCKALGQSGFRVTWIADGQLAQRDLAEHDYDALVLDLGLPGKSGHEVLQQLRVRDQRLPVLILTARDSLAERVSTLNEGADDFLAKPFALPELEARLMALVRRSRGIEHPRFALRPAGIRRGDAAVHARWREADAAAPRARAADESSAAQRRTVVAAADHRPRILG